MSQNIKKPVVHDWHSLHFLKANTLYIGVIRTSDRNEKLTSFLKIYDY
jgi:hypothetical protein